MGFFSSGLIAAGLLAVGTSASAQTEDLNARDPRLKEGQMFVVKLIPAGKRLQVLITGKEAARVDFGQLGMQATLFVGDKAVSLTPKRDKDRFIIDAAQAAHDKASRLKIEVKEGAKQEQFEFDKLP
ncbi:MAG: hypothetical protein JNJ49_02910 [Bdellovibrionaceae bacterium]|nr:hypothetical protein [Pseudobdellovibrionaceae bacterium]